MTKVAVVQMVSTADREQNLAAAKVWLAKAVYEGADFVLFPENFAFMGFEDSQRLAVAENPGQGVIQNFLAQQSQLHKVWLLGGSLPLKTADPKQVRSASLLYSPEGKCVARYDKIHLFDVEVADNKHRYSESDATEPGSEVVVANTSFGKIGLSVCYDLRFPELYRSQVEQGAVMLAVPSAFTAVTGAAHWQALLRARAIENLAFVLAPGQGGIHQNKRATYGHSMIIDPWGIVLQQLTTGPGMLVADLDFTEQQAIRKRFPALTHRKL